VKTVPRRSELIICHHLKPPQHFPALGQDLHNAVSSVRMGHADFPVRERAIESPAAITQKHLHRHAAAATVVSYIK